jgi:hypothetical protein
MHPVRSLEYQFATVSSREMIRDLAMVASPPPPPLKLWLLHRTICGGWNFCGIRVGVLLGNARVMVQVAGGWLVDFWGLQCLVAAVVVGSICYAVVMVADDE